MRPAAGAALGVLALSCMPPLPAHAADGPTRTVAGTVFEDPDGDGLPDDRIPVHGATVELWRDGGDGRPDGADDVRVWLTLTERGAFSFRGLSPEAAYWVAVDARTVAPPGREPSEDSGWWAEQTWGGPGSLCGGPAGVQERGDAACYGGRRPDRSDGPALADREHVARVPPGGEVHDLAFGFSFRVVTRTDDADDDPGARHAQGTLRQAVANAALRAGPIRFVPLSGEAPWSVALAEDLQVAGQGTVLDGTAWCDGAACPLGARRVPFPELLGTGGRVGEGPDGAPDTGDEPLLPRLRAPTLVLDGGGRARVRLVGPVELRNVAVVRSGVVVEAAFATISDALVGVGPDGAPAPGEGPGITVLADDALIRRALVSARSDGIVRPGRSRRLTVQATEIVGAEAGPEERAGVRLSAGSRQTGSDRLERLLVRDLPGPAVVVEPPIHDGLDLRDVSAVRCGEGAPLADRAAIGAERPGS